MCKIRPPVYNLVLENLRNEISVDSTVDSYLKIIFVTNNYLRSIET